MRERLIYFRPALLYAILLWIVIAVYLGLAHFMLRPAPSIVLITIDTLSGPSHSSIFDLDAEANIPSWDSNMKLLGVAILSAALVSGEGRRVWSLHEALARVTSFPEFMSWGTAEASRYRTLSIFEECAELPGVSMIFMALAGCFGSRRRGAA